MDISFEFNKTYASTIENFGFGDLDSEKIKDIFKDGRVFYEIESASGIIKGIIVLLIKILSGQRPEEIKNADLYFIDKAELRENFSPLRANSLWKLLNRMKSDAVSYAEK